MSEKPFKPSSRKIKKARKQGQVLKSNLLSRSVALFFGLSIGFLSVFCTWVRSEKLIKYCLEDSLLYFHNCLSESLSICFQITFFCLLGFSIVAFVVEFLQVGWMFEVNLIFPKFERLNPVSKLKDTVENLTFEILKFLVVLLFLASAILSIFLLADQTLLFVTVVLVIFFLSSLSISDYIFKRRKFLKSLSMSQKDLRDELKETEGDPLYKIERKYQHQQVLLSEIVERVKRSKVILVAD